MFKLITLMIVLTNCTTTVTSPNRCPRVAVYNYSNQVFNKIDMKYIENAHKLCVRKNKNMPCALWLVKRGEISYHIQCMVKPNYNGFDPIMMKDGLPK